MARAAVRQRDPEALGAAMTLNHEAQTREGAERLICPQCLGRLICGAGHGGYAVYLFAEQRGRDGFVGPYEGAMAVEPYDRWSAMS